MSELPPLFHTPAPASNILLLRKYGFISWSQLHNVILTGTRERKFKGRSWTDISGKTPSRVALMYPVNCPNISDNEKKISLRCQEIWIDFRRRGITDTARLSRAEVSDAADNLMKLEAVFIDDFRSRGGFLLETDRMFVQQLSGSSASGVAETRTLSSDGEVQFQTATTNMKDIINVEIVLIEVLVLMSVKLW